MAHVCTNGETRAPNSVERIGGSGGACKCATLSVVWYHGTCSTLTSLPSEITYVGLPLVSTSKPFEYVL